MTNGKDSEGTGPGQTPTTQKPSGESGSKGAGKGTPVAPSNNPDGGSK